MTKLCLTATAIILFMLCSSAQQALWGGAVIISPEIDSPRLN